MSRRAPATVGEITPSRVREKVSVVRKLAAIVPVILALMFTAAPKSASAGGSGHAKPFPTVSTTLRLVAKYPNGLTPGPRAQVLANSGKDVVMLLEDDGHSTGGCIHDQIAEVGLRTGKLQLGPIVTCYAWLFRSGTGQVYLTGPDHHGTELLRLNSRLIPVRVAVVGFAPTGFRAGAPVPGTDEMWLALVGRVVLFNLSTARVLTTLSLPGHLSDGYENLSVAGPTGPLYVTFCYARGQYHICKEALAEVDTTTGKVLSERHLDSAYAWPVAMSGGVFVGMANQGRGNNMQVYSVAGLRLLSGRYGFGGVDSLEMTAAGRVVWWSEDPLGGGLKCAWLSTRGSLGYLGLTFGHWMVWGNPVGIEPGTGDLILAGTAATYKVGESGLFAISTPRQCKAHM